MNELQSTSRTAAPDPSRRSARRAGNAVLTVFVAVLAFPIGAVTRVEAAAQGAKTFATPEDAVTALVAAAGAGDLTALIAILGPQSRPLVSSGDAVADQSAREKFVRSYQETHAIEKVEAGRAILQTGADRWPFPIPIVETKGGWRFDTQAGQQELLDRRIGANEIAAIQACLAYGDAQREYQDRNPTGAPIAPYAQKLASSPGQRDGLYWEAGEGEAESPLGPLFASARAEGYALGGEKKVPFHGYEFRILTSQGPHAPGGAFDYRAHGGMIGGFALVAYPAQWGASGIMTFATSHSGKVYQKDLGPQTVKLARQMTTFDPDASWTEVDVAAVTAAPANPHP